MAKGSTRNKIKLQAAEAFRNLEKAQTNLTGIAAFSQDRSVVIDEYLPELMATLEALIEAVSAFEVRL